jgi:hypothetical protein
MSAIRSGRFALMKPQQWATEITELAVRGNVPLGSARLS